MEHPVIVGLAFRSTFTKAKAFAKRPEPKIFQLEQKIASWLFNERIEQTKFHQVVS